MDKVIYQVRSFSEIKKEDTLIYQEEEELKKIIRQLVDKNNRLGDMGYSKRNMWIYDKLISLDEGKRFINYGNGIVRIKEAFKGKRKVKLINSDL